MKRFLRAFAGSVILTWTVIVNLYHAGVYPPPQVNLDEKAQGEWLDRSQYGINHLILQGPPFARGKLSGELTGNLLLAQEEQLVAQLSGWIPSTLAIQGLVLGAITWFQGVDKYIDTAFTQEMYGTSLSAPKSFDYLADGFTRQVAYHGLHEVGQMMVDQGFEDMGCTVVAVPFKNTFVLGRNFDFEGGRIFDNEKIIKWVFPEKGYAFVSVIWAGMVGAVTGVNERGVYISINAAGSSDYRRLGTPSTLIVLKILEEAGNVQEAVKILESAQMFITDIFVIMDGAGQLVRVEKSPKRMAVVALAGPNIVTNHLLTSAFRADSTNQRRMEELTSIYRLERGEELIKRLPPAATSLEAALQVLSILRDKGVDNYGKPLNLGNRRAIDALIATHSVILDPLNGIFYVSQGPAVAGGFQGFDLKESFSMRHPVKVPGLPADPLVPVEKFNAVKDTNQKISKAHRLARAKKCSEGIELLKQIPAEWQEQSSYHHALGDALRCSGLQEQARSEWTKALALSPAYPRFQRQLERNLQQ